MKGKVLDFNVQSGEGVISGDDSQRYNFVSAEWKSTDTHPAQNVGVDFSVNEGNATAIYADNVTKTVTNQEGSSGTAKIIYITYLAGLLIPFVSLIGLIMAYINKGSGPQWLDENYRFQIRTFWIGFLYFTVSFLLMAILIGWITLLVALAWYIIRCVKGLKAVGENRAPDNVDGWLF